MRRRTGGPWRRRVLAVLRCFGPPAESSSRVGWRRATNPTTPLCRSGAGRGGRGRRRQACRDRRRAKPTVSSSSSVAGVRGAELSRLRREAGRANVGYTVDPGRGPCALGALVRRWHRGDRHLLGGHPLDRLGACPGPITLSRVGVTATSPSNRRGLPAPLPWAHTVLAVGRGPCRTVPYRTGGRAATRAFRVNALAGASV